MQKFHSSASHKRLENARPPLWFTAAYRNHVREKGGDTAHKASILRLTRSNVVMHSTTKQSARQHILWRLLGRKPDPTARGPHVAALRSNNMASTFAHYRFHTTSNGKMLSFVTGNTIRAGRHTHGDSVLAALSFQWYLHQITKGKQPPWITAISTPNTVLTGEIKKPLNPTITKSWTVTKTTKFPGCAVTVPGCPGKITRSSQSRFITPQLT
jgi:hypothetical protein